LYGDITSQSCSQNSSNRLEVGLKLLKMSILFCLKNIQEWDLVISEVL